MNMWAVLLMLTLAASGCGGSSPSADRQTEPADTPAAAPTAAPAAGPPSGRADQPAAPGTVTRLDATSDLDTTPISAADYAMYAAIMGGASAMLSSLSPEDRAALELERRVAGNRENSAAANRAQLQRARALHEKDLELAQLQGIEPRYRKLKEKIEAVIGPSAQPPAANDRVGQENLRYLAAHRENIERLQRILRDPLSRSAQDR